MNTLVDNAQDLLDHLTIGVALVNAQHQIVYSNKCFRDFAKQSESTSIEGEDFYEFLKLPQIIDGCYAPFHFALSEEGTVFRSVLFCPRLDQTFELLIQSQESSNHEKLFRIELKDISDVNRNEKRLQSLKNSGKKLSIITDLGSRSSNDQREELKRTLREQMDSRVLNYNIFEIRTIEEIDSRNEEGQCSKKLIPFTSFGLCQAARERELSVSANGDNGITGFVASSGESYICNDTKNDPFYKQGAIDAKSSLTVPLVYNNKVIGTCNVESTKPNNFSSQDQLFLELYAKDIAHALHLLDYASNIKKEDFHTYAEHYRSFRNSLSNSILKLMYGMDENVGIPLSAQEKKAYFDLLDRTTCFPQQVQETILPHQEEEDLFKKARIASFENKYPDLIRNPKIDWSTLKEFLRAKKILSIAPSPILEKTYLTWLDPLVEQIDVVSSTSQALWLLKSQKYDIVLTELSPDGRYFEPIAMNEAHDNSKYQINVKGLSVFEIHKGEDYWLPIEGNQEDKETRARIYEEIYSNKKRDAFFFIKEVAENLQLAPLPLFFIIPYEGNEYDPTHIIRDITGFLKEKNKKWTLFLLPSPEDDAGLINNLFKRMYKTYTQNKELKHQTILLK